MADAGLELWRSLPVLGKVGKIGKMHTVTPSRPASAGVVFDMDGTLIAQAIDFDAIRRELGLPFGTALARGR